MHFAYFFVQFLTKIYLNILVEYLVCHHFSYFTYTFLKQNHFLHNVFSFKKAKKVIEAQKSGITTPTYPVDKWHYDENNADKNAFHGWVFQDSDAYKWL